MSERIEGDLVTAEELFELLVNETTEYAMCVLDVDGRIAGWNRGAERILGFRTEEIVGQSHSVFFPDEEASRGKPEAALRKAKRNGPVKFEGWRVRKDGSRFWGRVTLTALRDPRTNALRGFAKIVRDESDRRSAAESQATVSAAERAVESRDNILGVVAHDLLNLLNSISLSAAALDRDLAGHDCGERSQMLVTSELRAADRMSRLIHDLLDVTTIEANELKLEPVPVEPAKLVDDALDAARPLAVEHTLVAERPGALSTVFADPDRILQVFSNLVSNALKFTPEGGRITIGAKAGEGEISFWVADTGPGIPAEDVPHVFDRFWRASRKGNRSTGLGLRICKGIIDGHGGRIWLESACGAGTTFFFTLPCNGGGEPQFAGK